MFVNLHQHDINSNGNMIECISKVDDYIEFARKNRLPAVAITNHGNVVGWVKRKKLIEAAGLKFIHGIEAYVTDHIREGKQVADNYHTILLAKNWDGVKEINALSSTSYQRDGHFYFKPRITFDELKATSDNIYVTTACLGGAIWQTSTKGRDEELGKWMEFIHNNKHRVFLEVQPHLNKDQIELNKSLQLLRKSLGARLIASNDVHAVNKDHNRVRQILKKAKNIEFETDDEFDLWAKNEDEMRAQFNEQGVLTKEEIDEAFATTFEIVQSVEPFELDRSHKYPKLFDDNESVFQDIIKHGMIDRGIMKKSKEERQKYISRVNHEYKTFKHNGSIDYMLADWSMIDAANKKNIDYGYGRGSVAGSLIAYLTHSTEIDPLKFNLNFERFMNKERISLADIDHDFAGDDKETMQKWLLTNPKLHCASIMTANTYQMKGAVKEIARGLEPYASQPQYKIEQITQQINVHDEYPQSLYEEHRELFDLAHHLIGVVSSFGRHAAGIVVSTEPINETIGTMTLTNWDYPVTQLDMKDIDYQNFTKFDVLGLDNVGLISKTAKLVGIPYPTPDSKIIDPQDEKVWKSMAEDNVAIFQFESDRAGDILRHMFSPETIERIRKEAPDIQFMDLLSLANAAQRPAGASYIEAVTEGKFKDNGHPALNKFLESTLGNLVYQEQQTQLLVEFCGWTVAEADLIRRGIGKKSQEIMDREVPKIKPAFVKTMIEKYNDRPDHAEAVADSFIQVFMDSVNYGFSINHSTSYSWIGYVSAWLRYYYPLEFCTAALEIWHDAARQDKASKIIDYATRHGIKLDTPKFGHSKGSYYFDKATNTIYQGTSALKSNNAITGDSLYEVSHREYKTFIDFLMRIKDGGIIHITSENADMAVEEFYKKHSADELKAIDKAIKENPEAYRLIRDPIAVNKTQMLSLIRIGYFDNFGKGKKLEQLFMEFIKVYNPKNKTHKNKAAKYKALKELENTLDDTDYSLTEKCEYELFYMGRVVTHDATVPAKYAFVTSVQEQRSRIKANIYSIKAGKEIQLFVPASLYRNVKFAEGDLLDMKKVSKRAKSVLVDGEWHKSNTEFNYWLDQTAFIRKGMRLGENKKCKLKY